MTITRWAGLWGDRWFFIGYVFLAECLHVGRGNFFHQVDISGTVNRWMTPCYLSISLIFSVFSILFISRPTNNKFYWPLVSMLIVSLAFLLLIGALSTWLGKTNIKVNSPFHFVCLCACASFSLFICFLFVRLPGLFVYLFVCLFVCFIRVCLWVCWFVHSTICIYDW